MLTFCGQFSMCYYRQDHRWDCCKVHAGCTAKIKHTSGDKAGIQMRDFCMCFRWRHSGWDGVSNHQPHDCLLNCLFSHGSKKISELRVTNLCAGNSPVTGEFPAQMASNAENVSIWWRHHGFVVNMYLHTSMGCFSSTRLICLIQCQWNNPYMGKICLFQHW